MKALDIIKKYRLDEKQWTNKGLHGILHFFFPVGELPIKPLRRYYGDSHTLIVFYFSNNYVEWYWNDEDMTRLRNSFIKKVNNNPKILTKLVNDWHKRLRVLDKVMGGIDKTDLSKISDKGLMDLYYRWYNAYLDEYGIAIGIQDAFSMHADRFLFPHFERTLKKHGMDANEKYPILTAPVTDSFITQEYKNRLRLLKELRKTDKSNIKFIDRLKKHSKRYHWVQNNYAKNTYLDENYFLQQLKQMSNIEPDKELVRLDNERKDVISKKKQLIKQLMLDKESRNLIKITEVFAYMQDERKKYVLIANYYQDLFLKELQKRLNLKREEIEYTHIHELRSLLKQKKVNPVVFRERKKNVIVINTLKGYEVISGKVAREIYDKAFKLAGGKVTELKGLVASRGKVEGVVKVVRKIHDLVNVHDGAILVVSMTRPEMIVAIKRATAIVTDEGGITSHAAIVSRELGIPCIIGTKIATKVLKDGDKVEVDADKGVIRKIK